MNMYADKVILSSALVIRYIYILIFILVVLLSLFFFIIKQQSDQQATLTLKTHNFYLVGSSLVQQIKSDIERIRVVLLLDDGMHEKDQSHTHPGVSSHESPTKLIYRINQTNQRLQKLHKTYRDPDFDQLLERLASQVDTINPSHLINEHSTQHNENVLTEKNFQAIYISAHQAERIYSRKLEELGDKQPSWFNTLSPIQLSLIGGIMLLAFLFTTMIFRAIRKINHEQAVIINDRAVAQRELEDHQAHLEELVKQRSQQLETAHNELLKRERLAVLGQLTATVSHELRNPLGAIRPSLYILRKKLSDPDEKIINAMDRIDRNVQRCDHIVDELLDFTRNKQLEYSDLELNSWLRHTIEEMAIASDIQVNLKLAEADISVKADRNRLQRVVINLVENACHAMLEPYETDKYLGNSQLNVITRQDKDNVYLVIADNGSGMDNEVLSQIFTPLFSTKGFGVGLGMPAVKSIIEQHGGKLEIESDVDKGTSVTVILPLHPTDII